MPVVLFVFSSELSCVTSSTRLGLLFFTIFNNSDVHFADTSISQALGFSSGAFVTVSSYFSLSTVREVTLT